MGIILDSNVFIAAERQNWSAQYLLSHLERTLALEKFEIPATVAAELVHGIFRSKTAEQTGKRTAFVEEVLYALPVVPITKATAWIAGRVRGEQARIGNTLPFADSLIAATALEFDYALLTANIKDFISIPGLRVLQFSLP